MKEIDIQNSIRLALNPYAIVFRANVGVFNTADGRTISTGLPKGFSDLFGFRKKDGKMFFIEVKNEKGRLRKDQEHFIETMRQNGAIAGVARSPEEAIALITSGSYISMERLNDIESRYLTNNEWAYSSYIDLVHKEDLVWLIQSLREMRE
jgi:hypothetical protein